MKNRFSRPLVGLALLSVLCSPALAQLQDGPPINVKDITKELTQLETAQTTNSGALVQKVIRDFSAGAGSNSTAIALYQSALMATKNQTANDVQDIARMEQYQMAARVHLNYLVLSIQHFMGATVKQLEPGLNAHITAVMQAEANDAAIWMRRDKARKLVEQGNVAANPTKGKMAADKEPLFSEISLVTQPVSSSVFVQWYGIKNLLAPAKGVKGEKGGEGQGNGSDWEMVPGNIDGIYQSTLLPYYRSLKDARAVQYWEMRIKDDAQKAANTNSAFTIDQFNRIQKPELLWSRAQDEIAIGLRNRGIADMMDVVRNCPDHPKLKGWIAEIKGIVGAGAAKPADAPAAAPAPAASEAPAAPAAPAAGAQ